MSDKLSDSIQENNENSSVNGFVEIALKWGIIANGTAEVATLAAIAQLWSAPGAPVTSLCNTMLVLFLGFSISIFGMKLSSWARNICAQLGIFAFATTVLIEVPLLNDAWLAHENAKIKADSEKQLIEGCEKFTALMKETESKESALRSDRRRMDREIKTAFRKMEMIDVDTDKKAYLNAVEDLDDAIKECESSSSFILFDKTGITHTTPCMALLK